MKKGTTRLVFYMGKMVFKIANFTYSQQNFLSGCLANHNERLFCKQFKTLPHIELVAKTYFSSWFGLISIQERVDVVHFDVKSFPVINEIFKDICQDYKSENFGLRTNDRSIVCLDYG
ncbi:hypothetical protein [Sphingobacterium detergens]